MRPIVYFDIAVGGSTIGRIEFELFSDVTPLTAENFRALCTGEKGDGSKGKPLHFKGASFHRIIHGFMAQGGDFTNHDGTGGESIYGEKFKDENFLRKHDRRGCLSMANAGPNTNGSQFFITFKPVPHLNMKHVVFGMVRSGMDVLDVLENVATDSRDRPQEPVIIKDCGEVKEDSPSDKQEEKTEKKEKAKPQVNRQDRSDFLYSAVRRKVDKNQKQRGKESEYVKNATAEFPVPTPSNPFAHFTDEEARRAAEEKLDERKASRSEKELEKLKNMDPRKRRLLELRQKMSKGRLANQKEVLEEHKRENSKGLTRRKREQEWKEQEENELNKLIKVGGTAEMKYMAETAEKAQSREAKKRKKMENAKNSMNRGGMYNQDAAYYAYKRRTQSIPSLSKDAVVQGSSNALDFGKDGEADPEHVQRMVDELGDIQKRRVAMRKKSKGKSVEGEDITGINMNNDKWNKRLGRAYDKYTLETRQNIERGTAL
mmetsp:Transcript_14800/g.17292  ORF Transcript_14800/g.17292 Transcript_14800/m.17292 type:complete len:487 (+) Transcript_14800:181-1641(+)